MSGILVYAISSKRKCHYHTIVINLSGEPATSDLQVLEDGLSVGDLENVLFTLTLGVGDLAVVNDDGVAASAALSVDPVDALGEAGLRVRQEEL